MSYGEKISELRKKSGMTQAALGDKLNVTYQAVSKWERDESDPDFSTMSKIAKLFNVPLTYFEDEESAVAQAEPTVQAQSQAPIKIDVEELIREEERIKAAKERAKQAQQEKERKEREKMNTARAISRRNRGLIAGGILTVISLVITILLISFSSEPVPLGFGFCVVVIVFGFPFFSQLFWDGFIIDVLLCGGKIIGTPGIIFSFDLDGFIFLIAMKILFAVIKLLFFVLTLLFFVFIAILLSPFAFVPQLLKLSRGEEL